MYIDKKVYAVIVAAGSSRRMGFDKMLYQVSQGLSVVEKSILAFENNSFIDEIVVVAGDNIEIIKEKASKYKKVTCVVSGGKTRGQSVLNALKEIPPVGLVAIHDGARPFVSEKIINDTVMAAYENGAAIPCVKVKDTIKVCMDSAVMETVDRNLLYITQTPQIFDIAMYLQYSDLFFDENITDDSQIFEKAGHMVAVVPGEYENFKITTIEDLKKENKMRIGHGYDVHKLVENRKLILGGVDIPYEKGLLGHSDADVLTHAIMDSLLGALALGDIGKHFPDSDERYKGADSIKLLEHVANLIKEKNAVVENIDATLLCQQPKLAPHILTMRENIAKAMEIDLDNVSIKATTEEGLGFTGEGLGIACHCVCLVNC